MNEHFDVISIGIGAGGGRWCLGSVAHCCVALSGLEIRFDSLTQGGARFTSLALGYHLSGFQPLKFEPPAAAATFGKFSFTLLFNNQQSTLDHTLYLC